MRSIYQKGKDEPTMEGVPLEKFFQQLDDLRKRAKKDPALRALIKAAHDDMSSFYETTDQTV